jgi:hypothetical protein
VGVIGGSDADCAKNSLACDSSKIGHHRSITSTSREKLILWTNKAQGRIQVGGHVGGNRCKPSPGGSQASVRYRVVGLIYVCSRTGYMLSLCSPSRFGMMVPVVDRRRTVSPSLALRYHRLRVTGTRSLPFWIGRRKHPQTPFS